MTDEKEVAKKGGESGQQTTGMSVEHLLKMLAASSQGQDRTPKSMEEYKFWKTQPVTKFGSDVDQEGPIENKTVEEVAKEPMNLPEKFEWDTVDISKPEEVNEIYELLYYNYIEDDDATFRFKYSPEFLNWALTCPGWNPEWNIGVRVKDEEGKGKGKLVGIISGIPARIRVRDNEPFNIAEINFLCVHKKLRSKRLAPMLIREVTRRVNLTGVWQALYTAGTVLPSPVSTCRYYHRSINWPKLYDVGFSPLPVGSTPAKQVARFALPNEPTLPNLREMTEQDIPQVHKLLTEYVQRYDISPVFSEDELKHWFLHNGKKSGVVYSYVVTNGDGQVTDFFNFYGIESSVLGNKNHDSIKVAYSFYYATDVALKKDAKKQDIKKRLTAVFQDALILAKKYDYDVFNALSLQDNPLFLEDLKFGPGDGFLNYYLFNYKAFPVHGGIDTKDNLEYKPPGGMGVVLL
jgi:glycylpeptide N-tetradecanoyltransferase